MKSKSTARGHPRKQGMVRDAAAAVLTYVYLYLELLFPSTIQYRCRKTFNTKLEGYKNGKGFHVPPLSGNET